MYFFTLRVGMDYPFMALRHPERISPLLAGPFPSTPPLCTLWTYYLRWVHISPTHCVTAPAQAGTGLILHSPFPSLEHSRSAHCIACWVLWVPSLDHFRE